MPNENNAVQKSGKRIDSPIIKLYLNGKLGQGMTAVCRLQAGIRFCEDYRRAFFTPRLTMVYDNMPRAKNRNGAADAFACGKKAADRYLAALKAVKKYEIYALHFLRDEENVHQFILKYPVLCGAGVPTYRAVYEALCKMLDILADFYAKDCRQGTSGA